MYRPMLTSVHQVIGLAIAGFFILLSLMGLFHWARNRHPGKIFWKVLAAGQAGLVVQVLWGVVLFALRGGQHWLHYVYGAFPILVLLFAHRVSRRLEGIEWAAFAVAGVFIFGLQLRGMMTGA